MGKGNKQRVVPIGQTALRLLENYVRAVCPFLVRDPGQAALFLDHFGRRIPYYTFRRMVRSYAAGAALPAHVSAHAFRRSCATELIRGGANIYHVIEGVSPAECNIDLDA